MKMHSLYLTPVTAFAPKPLEQKPEPQSAPRTHQGYIDHFFESNYTEHSPCLIMDTSFCA
jgi:hypothetical protein